MSKFTKLEREYVKGVVHNLTIQRLSDREIVQWLHDEKGIDMDRSNVTKIRNQVEKDATNWYISNRDSVIKSIVFYKDRLDSLLSYQKKLHEVINQFGKSPEIVIRAISELHKIEISLNTFSKEMPVLNIETKSDIDTETEGRLPYRVDNEIESKAWAEQRGLSKPLSDGKTWLRCYDCHHWFMEDSGNLERHKETDNGPSECSHIFSDQAPNQEPLKFKFEYVEPEPEPWTIEHTPAPCRSMK